MELSIVIPAYNEEKSIEETIKKINKFTPDGRIIIVDDGSSDSTRERAEKLGVSVISHKRNRGYGAALKTGFRNSETELITFLDADLTYHPKYLPALLERLKRENLDIAWGNRFGGSINKMPLTRKFGNRMISLILFLVSLRWVNDCTSGERLFRREFLEKIDIESLSDDLDFITGLTARIVKRKARFEEIPMDYHERGGSSKLKRIKHGYKMVRNVIVDR
jgi:glycosyltransferase involved in cell wall biosynthesis